MEENKPVLEEYVPTDVDCANCTGNWVQAQIPLPNVRLFTPVYFIKWCYICQKCGLKSKVFCSKIGNKVK